MHRWMPRIEALRATGWSDAGIVALHCHLADMRWSEEHIDASETRQEARRADFARYLVSEGVLNENARGSAR